jgi:hypothetical protein
LPISEIWAMVLEIPSMAETAEPVAFWISVIWAEISSVHWPSERPGS